MVDKNEILYQLAWDAIMKLFGDTTVDPETTKERLEALREEIDVLVESLDY